MIIQKLQKKFVIKQYFEMGAIRKTFSLLRPYIIQHRKAYWGLFLLTFVDIALTLAFAWFFGNITDAAIQSDFQRLKRLVPIGLSFMLLSTISSYLYTLLETVATTGVKKEFSAHFFKHLLMLPTRNVANLHSGELISHFTNDIHSINGIIGSSLINLIRLPFIYIAVFIYLAHISWTLALLNVLVAPIAMIVSIIFGLFLRRNGRLIHNLIGNINSLLNETFLGFLVIRSFTMEKSVFKKYITKNQELYSLELSNAKLRGYFYVGGQAVSSITFLASLCLGAYFVSTDVLSIGALLTFLNLANHLIYPLTDLASQWADFQRSASAMERILNILEQPTEATDLPTYSPSRLSSKSIQFQSVTFSYDGQRNILDNFNLQIAAGKVVAIVGSSGAGKTTLFNLLQDFYRPQTGTILIDNIPTQMLSTAELRSSIAHVPQETFLFGGTIRDNLLLVRDGIIEAEMVHAAAVASIHDFITSLPNGYDTEIGERGIKLSGGQKQRIAIARAVLKDAPILLLDEATSALDSQTEQQVKEALDRLMINRTTLVIAHRLSTIQNADLIIVMDEGKIVQTGRHEELMTQDGLYRNLYHTQLSQQLNEDKALP
ncbi:ABC transporter ATP-binding protein/permease [Ectobacillus funiculus]|uniref:ABC transporter ATP-binding protein n=1 Tax=Ectobacillus funiculus TaxID=137993 RepID=UPI00397C9EE6